MSGPAKLQLLTRSPDESEFEIFEIDSGQVHSLFKPQRLPETEWELMRQPLGIDGTRNFVLKNLRRDRYLLLSTKEYFLWERFDGKNSLDEIARAFHLEFGAFDYSIVRELLVKLYQVRLIEGSPTLAPQTGFISPQTGAPTSLPRRCISAWRRFAIRTGKPDRYCSAIYRRGGVLLFYRFTFYAVVAMTLVALAAAYQLAGHSLEFARLLSTKPFLSIAVMLITLPVASMLHVLVHALACKANDRRVRELGFLFLQGVLPTFYADVTDIFMTNRRARLIVDLAGPMVEVALGSAAMLGAYSCDLGVTQALLFGTGVLLWESAFINLYPFSFLELDGYNILADLLVMPMLRKQALALIPSLPQRLRNPRMIQRAEWIQIGYLVLCFFSVFVYLVLHLDAIRALLPSRLI